MILRVLNTGCCCVRIMLTSVNGKRQSCWSGNDVRYEAFTAKRSLLERTLQNLSSTHLPPNAEVLAKLAELGTAPIRSGMSLLDLLRRSEMTYEKLQQAFEVPELPEVVAEQVEIFAKYEGYINKQKQEVEKALKLENKKYRLISII